jgi:hypothetical protein
MAMLSLRAFGLLLLTLTIGVSSCQALLPGGSDDSRPFTPGFLQE